MESLIRFSDVRLAGVALLSKRAHGGTGKRIEGVKRGVHGPWDLARRCCFWLLVGVLAGCAGLSDTFEVEPFLREQITGDTWRACLAREYQRQARIQVHFGEDWRSATLLASKGRAALAGDEVAPEPAATTMLAGARRSLQAALSRREDNPCDCAVVQGKYDGWTIVSARKLDTGPIRAAFDRALKACTTPR
jgi:hypothetical protein